MEVPRRCPAPVLSALRMLVPGWDSGQRARAPGQQGRAGGLSGSHSRSAHCSLVGNRSLHAAPGAASRRAGAWQAQPVVCLSSVGHAGLAPPKHQCRVPETPSPWQALPVQVGVSADHCWEARHRSVPAPRCSNPSWHRNAQVEL